MGINIQTKTVIDSNNIKLDKWNDSGDWDSERNLSPILRLSVYK